MTWSKPPSGRPACSAYVNEEAMQKSRQRVDNYVASVDYRRVESAHYAYLCGTERATEGITGL